MYVCVYVLNNDDLQYRTLDVIRDRVMELEKESEKYACV